MRVGRESDERGHLAGPSDVLDAGLGKCAGTRDAAVFTAVVVRPQGLGGTGSRTGGPLLVGDGVGRLRRKTLDLGPYWRRKVARRRSEGHAVHPQSGLRLQQQRILGQQPGKRRNHVGGLGHQQQSQLDSV